MSLSSIYISGYFQPKIRIPDIICLLEGLVCVCVKDYCPPVLSVHTDVRHHHHKAMQKYFAANSAHPSGFLAYSDKKYKKI